MSSPITIQHQRNFGKKSRPRKTRRVTKDLGQARLRNVVKAISQARNSPKTRLSANAGSQNTAQSTGIAKRRRSSGRAEGWLHRICYRSARKTPSRVRVLGTRSARDDLNTSGLEASTENSGYFSLTMDANMVIRPDTRCQPWRYRN